MSEMTSYETDKIAEDASAKGKEKSKMQEQKAHIVSWCERLKFGRDHIDEYRERWAEDRKWAGGNVDWKVRANLISAILEVLAAFLYAKNPDVKVKPSDSVNRKRIADYRLVAQTLTVIVSRLLKDAGLKKIGKKWVRQSMTVGIGWIKAAMQTRTETNTIVEKELNDLQKNLKNIEALEQRMAQGDELGMDEEEELAMKAEIEANMTALESSKELMIAEGLILDVMAPEDVTIAPECGEYDNYLRAPWIALDFYKTKHEVMTLVDWDKETTVKKLQSANLYHKRPRKGEKDEEGQGNQQHPNYYSANAESDGSDKENESKDGFLRVTEIWCLDDGVVYTLIDGIKDCWAREPYAPTTGRRFYPIFDLPCHQIDGEQYPQSDVHQLKELQEEYNRTRTNFSTHRQRAVPGIIYNQAAVTAESVKAFTDSYTQEIVGLELTSPEIDIRTVFSPKAYAAVDMNLYNTEPMLREMEKVSGAQEAMQSSVNVEKTATEAKIQNSGFGARSDARRDDLEDSLSELSEYVCQLALLTFSKAEAIRYAGDEAVWVDMDTEDALMFFDISVKAGSTGKPEANTDREIWGTLLPQLENLIDRIGQARVMGQEWAAKPWIALLDETMKRLDDPAEIAKFLPVPPEEEVGGQEGPSESELAKIDLDKAKTEGERAEVLEAVAAMGGVIPPDIAMKYLLFGGEALANPQAPMSGQPAAVPPQELEEAPNPVE